MFVSALFRAKAREALRGHWLTALLIALVVNLPTLLVQGIATFTGNDLSVRLQDLLLEMTYSTGAVSSEEWLNRAWSIIQEPGIVTMLSLSALAWIVTPVLSLGMNHWALDRLRGQSGPVATVFSRLGIFFKGIVLRLLVSLKILLWMLPGVAMSFCSLIPLQNAVGKPQADQLDALQTGSMLIYGGLFLMLGLGLFAYLHYLLAELILADEPQERSLACVRRSKQLMAGRKGNMLSLLLSFLLWYILILLVGSLDVSLAGSVIILVLEMLGSLCLSVYMLLSKCAFYEALRK